MRAVPVLELAAKRAVLPHLVLIGARVQVRDGRITAIDAAPPSSAAQCVDGTLMPGFVDLQVNGGGGRSVDEATREALDTVAHAVWQGGAVAFLPTLITAPWEQLLQQVAAVADWIERAPRGGAEPLGLHVEGPFLEVSGVHDPTCFVDPTPARIDALLAAARGRLRLVTLANSRQGAAAAVARLRAAGVAVALGHVADPGGLDACVAAGATLVTHLFNAMGPIHHREPGVAGAALDEARLSCALLADGAHVHPIMLRNAFAVLGVDRTVLCSDAAAPMGMPDGDYALGGEPVHARAGVVRDGAGRLAGSALTMGRAAHTFAQFVPAAGDWTLGRVAASNPARIIGAADLGAIAVGRRAAFTLLRPDGTATALRC